MIFGTKSIFTKNGLQIEKEKKKTTKSFNILAKRIF